MTENQKSKDTCVLSVAPDIVSSVDFVAPH